MEQDRKLFQKVRLGQRTGGEQEWVGPGRVRRGWPRKGPLTRTGEFLWWKEKELMDKRKFRLRGAGRNTGRILDTHSRYVGRVGVECGSQWTKTGTLCYSCACGEGTFPICDQMPDRKQCEEEGFMLCTQPAMAWKAWLQL